MTKQKPLALTLDRFFRIQPLLLFVTLFFINFLLFAQEQKISKNIELKDNFPAAVIDMQKVLSKSTAWASLQNEVKKLEDGFKKEIKMEEETLKKEQENLRSQKSVLAAEQYKEKENAFKVLKRANSNSKKE